MTRILESLKTLAPCVLTAALLATMSAADARGGPTACERTASTMQRACTFDTFDDLSETLANCLNVGDPEDRRTCRREAHSAWREAIRECRDVREARRDACDLLGEDRYDPDPLLNPAITFIDPDDVPSLYAPNPFVTVEAGQTRVLRSEEETIVIHVTGESREIQGVLCRVVVDVVVEITEEAGDLEIEAIEVTDDWFAQSTAGDVYYCGEVARNFEDGLLRDLDGSFESGIDFAKSGVLIRQYPVPGEAHRQEYALGEAEDIVQYLGTASEPGADEGGENEAFPCGGTCLKTFEFAPLEPEASEFKYYRPDVGFVLAVGLEDGEVTGEREELVCAGDSLDVLHSAECGLADPDAVLEELCKLAPDAFCDD